MAELSVTRGRDIHTVNFPLGVPPDAVDVLIVGAGPVGLSAAIELVGHGVEVAVVDRSRSATLVRAGAMGHSPAPMVAAVPCGGSPVSTARASTPGRSGCG